MKQHAGDSLLFPVLGRIVSVYLSFFTKPLLQNLLCCFTLAKRGVVFSHTAATCVWRDDAMPDTSRYPDNPVFDLSRPHLVPRKKLERQILHQLHPIHSKLFSIWNAKFFTSYTQYTPSYSQSRSRLAPSSCWESIVAQASVKSRSTPDTT
jgi:hypothetical protein